MASEPQAAWVLRSPCWQPMRSIPTTTSMTRSRSPAQMSLSFTQWPVVCECQQCGTRCGEPRRWSSEQFRIDADSAAGGHLHAHLLRLPQRHRRFLARQPEPDCWTQFRHPKRRKHRSAYFEAHRSGRPGQQLPGAQDSGISAFWTAHASARGRTEPAQIDEVRAWVAASTEQLIPQWGARSPIVADSPLIEVILPVQRGRYP